MFMKVFIDNGERRLVGGGDKDWRLVIIVEVAWQYWYGTRKDEKKKHTHTQWKRGKENMRVRKRKKEGKNASEKEERKVSR